MRELNFYIDEMKTEVIDADLKKNKHCNNNDWRTYGN